MLGWLFSWLHSSSEVEMFIENAEPVKGIEEAGRLTQTGIEAVQTVRTQSISTTIEQIEAITREAEQIKTNLEKSNGKLRRMSPEGIGGGADDNIDGEADKADGGDPV